MSYLLDTSTCMAAIRGHKLLRQRYLPSVGSIHLSAVSVTDLELWIFRPRTPIRYGQVCVSLLLSLTILAVNEPIAHRAARVGNALRQQVRKANLDELLIVATALEHGLTLVSAVPQRFTSIPNLQVVDWTVP